MRARSLFAEVAIWLLALGSLCSALASGRLSVRLIFDGAFSFAFIPAITLGVGLFLRRGRTTQRPLAADLAAFASGNRPWLFWLAAASAIGSAIPPRAIGSWIIPLELSMLVPLFWSLVVDHKYFAAALAGTARSPTTMLAMHRALSWTLILAYFLGAAIWGEIVPGLLRSVS